MRYNGVVGLRSWRIDTMGKQKRPVLEGEDDGEGHSWKVLKANAGTVDVYYGKGGHARFQLKKADKTAPTEAHTILNPAFFTRKHQGRHPRYPGSRFRYPGVAIAAPGFFPEAHSRQITQIPVILRF